MSSLPPAPPGVADPEPEDLPECMTPGCAAILRDSPGVYYCDPCVDRQIEAMNAEMRAFERIIMPEFVTAVLNEDGTVYDHTYNWETAQSMALNEGYRIRSLRGDGGMSQKDIQALCDAERERYRDCFGLDD